MGIYQKLEKVIKDQIMAEEKKNKLIQLSLFIIFSVNYLIAQPDNHFDPFDWEIYSQSGRVNSISEDNTYFYFGTEMQGFCVLINFPNNLIFQSLRLKDCIQNQLDMFISMRILEYCGLLGINL